MGRLIEEQAVIDCLTNTAKYYDMPQADEWTKGIHYGLLHGLDNILDNVKLVEAIPKADYEARLKSDLEAILIELQLEIEELDSRAGYSGYGMPTLAADYIRKKKVNEIIRQKINSLKAKIEPQESEE